MLSALSLLPAVVPSLSWLGLLGVVWMMVEFPIGRLVPGLGPFFALFIGLCGNVAFWALLLHAASRLVARLRRGHAGAK